MQDLLGCWTSCPVLALLFFTCTNTGLYFITHKHNKKKLFIKVVMRSCNSLSTINISYFTGKTSSVFVQGLGLAFFSFLFFTKSKVFSSQFEHVFYSSTWSWKYSSTRADLSSSHSCQKDQKNVNLPGLNTGIIRGLWTVMSEKMVLSDSWRLKFC